MRAVITRVIAKGGYAFAERDGGGRPSAVFVHVGAFPHVTDFAQLSVGDEVELDEIATTAKGDRAIRAHRVEDHLVEDEDDEDAA